MHNVYTHTRKHSSQSLANINLGCIWNLNLQLPELNSDTDWHKNVPSLLFLSCVSLETALCPRRAVGFIRQIPCISLLWTLHGEFSPCNKENRRWWVSWMLKVHTKFTAVCVPLSLLLPWDCRHKSTASPTAAILMGQEVLTFRVLKQTISGFSTVPVKISDFRQFKHHWPRMRVI